MQNNLDAYDNHVHDGDEFIQYNKCKHEHKMLIESLSQCTPYQASITHTILALVSIVISDAWL